MPHRSRSRSSSRSRRSRSSSRSTSRTRSPSERSRSSSRGSRSPSPVRPKNSSKEPKDSKKVVEERRSVDSTHSSQERKLQNHGAMSAENLGGNESKDSPAVDASTAENENESEIHQLKRANEDLRKQLMQLNSRLDNELARRENRVKNKIRNRTVVTEARYSSLKQEVEELRREHALVKVQVYQNDGTSRVAEVRNQIAEKEKEIERLKEANRGLDRVKKSQARKMETVTHIENEMARIRTNHNEEIRILRDRLRRVKEVKEQDERTLKHIQSQINQLQDKAAIMKLLKQNGEVRSLFELERDVQAKEKLMKQLQDEVDTLQKKIESEKRKTIALRSITPADIDSLRKTVGKLKQELADREDVLAKEEKAVKRFASKLESANNASMDISGTSDTL